MPKSNPVLIRFTKALEEQLITHIAQLAYKHCYYSNHLLKSFVCQSGVSNY